MKYVLLVLLVIGCKGKDTQPDPRIAKIDSLIYSYSFHTDSSDNKLLESGAIYEDFDGWSFNLKDTDFIPIVTTKSDSNYTSTLFYSYKTKLLKVIPRIITTTEIDTLGVLYFEGDSLLHETVYDDKLLSSLEYLREYKRVRIQVDSAIKNRE
jgi:hypothetical protein